MRVNRDFLIGITILNIVVVSIAVLYSGSVPSQRLRLRMGLSRLVHESPDSNNIYQQIKTKANGLEITSGTLMPGDEAVTLISEDGNVQIIVDMEQVDRCKDRIEPVLAHELFHAYDGIILNKPSDFVQESMREQKLIWSKRPVEMRAIAFEDFTRLYLLEHYPKEYKGMLKTRFIQNSCSSK